MNILESIKMAYKSVMANKMRAFLTMLGIIIGISSVITIVSLGQGGQEAITGEFEKIGVSSIRVSVDATKAQDTDYITLEDVKQIKEQLNSIKYASPTIQIMGTISSEKDSHGALFSGGSPDLAYINNTEILYGRYFNEGEYESGAAVGIIEEQAALGLFGYADAVGETVTISDGNLSKKMTVIGVEKGLTMPLGNGNNQRPYMIAAPVTFLSNIHSSGSRISTVTVMANTQEEIDAAARGTINMLESRHNNRGQEIYSAENTMDVLDQINNVLGIFTGFIGAVAAISLLVGGIGVMNIMLVSVTERTREIGIRKAIGATTKTILIQFLIESVLISLIGGIIGMTLGIIGAEIIGSFAGIIPVVSPMAVLGAILFSSAVGIFFGIYPARKAARLDPIDALRYE